MVRLYDLGASFLASVAIATFCCLSSGVEALVVAASPTARVSQWAFRVRGPPITAPTVADGGRSGGAISGWPVASSAVVGRHGRRNGSLRMISLEIVSDAGIPEMAEFFVSNFWEEDVAPSQKRSLVRELVTDYRRRYGSLMGKRKLQSMLIAARSTGGDIVGCIAVEVSVCKGEQVGVKARGLSPNAEGVELRPILANLAVARAARRKGLAKRLVKRCEDEAKEWGYDEVLLLVEENNQRAKKLYQKLGYKMLFRDRDAKKIVPDSYQIRDVPCTNVCMRRDLNANVFFSNLFNLMRK